MKPLRTVAVLLLVAAALGPVSAQAAPAGPGGRPVAVRVLASGGWRALPVTGARLTALRGGRVVGRGRVGPRGVALLRVRGSGPLRIVTSGGRVSGHPFRGTMAAEVRRYRWPATVHVDSATTLASRYRLAHPGVTIAQAKGRTKRFLTLPPSYVVGPYGTSDAEFDGRRFLAAAGTGRRYDRFVARLAARIGNPKAHRSFAHVARRRRARASVSAATPSLGELDELTEAISYGRGVFEGLVGTKAVLEFAGTVLAISDPGTGNAETPAEIDQIGQQLQEMEQSIGVVRTTEEELSGQAAHAEYSRLAGEMGSAQAAIDSAETLQTAADLALDYNCPSDPQPLPQGCREAASMITGPGGVAAGLHSVGLTTMAAVGSFGEKIAGSTLPPLLPEPGQGFWVGPGLIQDGSALISYRPHQVFYTSADSTQLRALAAYWIARYAEALTMVGADLRVEGTSPATLEQEVGELIGQAFELSRLIPMQVPSGVAIDMAHGWMWPTEVTGAGTQAPFGTLVAGDPWSYSQASRRWTSASNPQLSLGAHTPGEGPGETGTGGAPAVPFGEWRIAGAEQVDRLLEAVTPNPGQLPGEAVVEQAGMSQSVIAPWYPGGHGLETERRASNLIRPSSACRSNGTNCWWPVLAGGEARVTSLHSRSPTYQYVDGPLEVPSDPLGKWFHQRVYGFDGSDTIFGSAPIEAIPVMFYRPIANWECYFYPAPEQPAVASPGCR